jgi:dinuclear metal center YbgI/SA1388 family protein
MKIQLQNIVQTLEQMAPPEYAASWDNTGLQIGAPDNPIRSILIALDITHGVIHEAIKKKVNLIITHHPLFFHPLKQIRTDSGTGNLVQKIIQAGIAVYAAHTNLDVVQDGVNDVLVKTLGHQGWAPVQELSSPDGIGWGRIGSLKQERPFKDFVPELKKALHLKWIRLIGKPCATVKTVACCSGSGAGLLPDVLRIRPDLYITGDIKYHEALTFQTEGMTVLDIGHFASEQGFRKALARKLRQTLKELGMVIPVYTSRSEQDPFKMI